MKDYCGKPFDSMTNILRSHRHASRRQPVWFRSRQIFTGSMRGSLPVARDSLAQSQDGSDCLFIGFHSSEGESIANRSCKHRPRHRAEKDNRAMGDERKTVSIVCCNQDEDYQHRSACRRTQLQASQSRISQIHAEKTTS